MTDFPSERSLTRRRSAVPTIGDVARRAELSPMTVSRVVNGEPGVRPETRARVEAVVAELGYVPNPAARLLAGVGQIRIALLYRNPSAAYLSEMLVGSLAQASRSQAQLVVERCDPDDDTAATTRRLSERGLDGVVLPPPLCDFAGLRDLLWASGIPAVLVATGTPPSGFCAVTIDDRAGAEQMTRHLLSLGHRRIGFVTGDPAQTATARRLDGYRAALAAAGTTPEPALVAAGDYSYRSGLHAAEQLLSREAPSSAIFASNDDMAAAAVAIAHRRGLDVPRDLTVVGFDDTAIATTMWPELTTIRQPIAEIAQAAIAMLIAGAGRVGTGGPSTIEHRVLPHQLIRRSSDGPARSP
jgi:LacI family transcriptional regulator